MVSHQEHPWNLLAKIFSQRRIKIWKWWPHSSSIALSGRMSAVHLNLMHQTKNIKVTILKLLRRLFSLTSINTSLHKNHDGKLFELYLTMISPLQVICLREIPKWKPNPISENLPTSKVHSILARLLHQRPGLIVFCYEVDWSILLDGSS